MDIIEERMKAREAVVARVGEWVSMLDFSVTAVLVGSYARGDFNLWSDVDVLLVSDSFPERPLDRLKMVDPPEGVEVIPLTRKDFYRLVNKKNPLVVDAQKYGILLRDDLGLFKDRQSST
jgi:predicted nucleotidyltransferase